MAFPCFSMLLSLLCLLLCMSSSLAKNPTPPKQFFLPIYKDPSTLQYVTQIMQRTPLVPVGLTVDLGGRYLWAVCDNGYNSTTIHSAGCGTTQCHLARTSKTCYVCDWGKIGPGCTNTETCWRYPLNTVTGKTSIGEVALDIVAISSAEGKGHAGNVVSVPRFIFVCASTKNADGLAKGVVGMAGLGRTKISLPAQLASALNLKPRFELCLSSSTTSNDGGVIIFGDGPYNLNSSSLLSYTSLIMNKVSMGEEQVIKDESSAEYFIGVKSIKINNKTVKLNTTLLQIKKSGYGGTKISTVNPYTVLETSIYNAVIKAFVNELKNVTRVPPVAPFGACFSSKDIASTRVGPAVPTIDLVMEENGVVWRMFGANTMVRVNNNVLCLGFVDGGEPTLIFTPTSIVIGGYQLEENLLTFDLHKSRLGFSSSLLFRQTTCSNYRAISNA